VICGVVDDRPESSCDSLSKRSVETHLRPASREPWIAVMSFDFQNFLSPNTARRALLIEKIDRYRVVRVSVAPPR